MKMIVAAAVLACLAGEADAQSIRSRLLPSLIDGAAAEPSIVADDRGFLMTWQARLEDGVTALRFRPITASGVPGTQREIARGAGWFVNWADFPSLAIMDNGDWLTHWLQRSGAGYAYDIHVVRSTDRGASWSSPAILHDDGTRSEHGFVAWIADGDAAARAVWLDGRHTGSAGHDHGAGHRGTGGGAMTLRSARVMRDGITDAVQIDARVCDCCQTDAVRVGTQTLVVYRDRSDDEIRDVRLARHDGSRWLATQPLFDDGWRIEGCPVNGPAIAARGRSVIAAAYSEAGGASAVRVRTSNDGGTDWNGAVIIATDSTLGRLDAVALDEERFLVARVDAVGDTHQLRVSLHDRSGTVVDTHAVTTAPAGHLPGFPRMASVGNATLIAWAQSRAGAPVVRAAIIDVDTAPGIQ